MALIWFLLGAVIGSLMIFFILKDNRDIELMEKDAEIERLRKMKDDVNIPKEEYHPENMERMTAKEIKYGGF
jgi:hypothetical protein